MRHKIAAVVIVLSFMALPAAGFAAENASPWTQAPRYWEKSLRKLDFGLKNLFFGWTELIEEPWMAWKNKEENMCAAKKRGLAHAVADTIGGALHLATFPIPQVDIPLPENGVEY
jgi:hypothetical protein